MLDPDILAMILVLKASKPEPHRPARPSTFRAQPFDDNMISVTDAGAVE